MDPTDKVIVYENPVCSKCRELKQVLTDKGIEFDRVNYMENHLSADALKQLLIKAGLTPQEALRKHEAAYQQHVAGRELTDDELLEIMATHPELIQRPIVVKGEKAVLARPVDGLKKLGID